MIFVLSTLIPTVGCVGLWKICDDECWPQAHCVPWRLWMKTVIWWYSCLAWPCLMSVELLYMNALPPDIRHSTKTTQSYIMTLTTLLLVLNRNTGNQELKMKLIISNYGGYSLLVLFTVHKDTHKSVWIKQAEEIFISVQ